MVHFNNYNFSKAQTNTLPDDGDWTEICRSCFNVNFNILLKQLYCISAGKQKTLILSRCTVQLWKRKKLSSSVHELLKFRSNKPIYSDRNHEGITCLSFLAEASNNFRSFSYRCDSIDFLTLPVTLIVEAAVPIWILAPSLSIRLSMNLLQ